VSPRRARCYGSRRIDPGQPAGSVDEFAAEAGPYLAGGGGFRYLLARKLGLQTGIDVARGPEETAFYIQVGSSW
jgi:hypothetical protein